MDLDSKKSMICYVSFPETRTLFNGHLVINLGQSDLRCDQCEQPYVQQKVDRDVKLFASSFYCKGIPYGKLGGAAYNDSGING